VALPSEPNLSAEKEIILTINNGHIEECGAPPRLTLGGGRWTCYFENVHGEQFIMQFDRNTDICRLWSGDVGWEEELRVEEFRDTVIVRFARTQVERAADSKMNKQLACDLPPIPDAEKAKIKKEARRVLRKAFGKPALTDEECEYLTHGPMLSEDEMDVVTAYWGICKQVRG
jgi:hypothetical protein